MELVENKVQVKAVKINDPLVDVFLVGALAKVFEDKLDGAVHRPQDLCSKRVLDHNLIFVLDDAVLSINVLHKIAKLGCKDAVFAKDQAYCSRKCFQLEVELVEVLGDRHCCLSQGFDIIDALDETPFCR